MVGLALGCEAMQGHHRSTNTTAAHHARLQPDAAGCLEHVWHQKLRKHATLVESRARVLAASPGTFRHIKTVFDPFEPTYTCQSEWRTGSLFGDGGKFVCGEDEYFKARDCLVYSVGSKGDTAFEADVIRRFGCEVHTFDPTGNSTEFAARLASVGATFHPWGVGPTGRTVHNGKTHQNNPLVSLYDIMDQLGHHGRHLDILKIDCEGCEWEAFSSLWPHILDESASVGQVQVELHGLMRSTPPDIVHDKARTFFGGAEQAGFMVFHKERNHWGCDGYKCVEYSLIHAVEARKLFEATHCREEGRGERWGQGH